MRTKSRMLARGLFTALAASLIAAALPMALVAPASAAPAKAYQLERQWNVSGGDGLAVDRRNGQVYVADYADDVVRRYSRTGKLLGSWSVDAPRGLTVDAKGRVLVLEHVGSLDTRVRVRTASGALVDEYGDGDLSFGADIAVAPSGHVYVADGMYHRVVRYNAAGTKLGQWGSEGTGNGEFDYASAITVGPQGHVYVTDRDNNRVQRFSAAGAFLGTWGRVGSAAGRMRSPAGLTTDASGRVYVADPGAYGFGVNRRVQIFTAAGGYVTSIGSPSSSRFSNNGPRSIDLDAAGRLFAVDYRGTSQTVKVLRPVTAKPRPKRAKVVSKKATLKGRTTKMKLSCPKKPKGICRGTLALKHKKKVVGKKKYAVKAGKKRVVKVKLTQKGAKIVKRAKPRKLTVVLNPGKGAKKVTKKVRLRRR